MNHIQVFRTQRKLLLKGIQKRDLVLVDLFVRLDEIYGDFEDALFLIVCQRVRERHTTI